MKIECKLQDGRKLDENEMMYVHDLYELMCTADYLYENYDITNDESLYYAGEVRRLMNKYDMSEIDAIVEIMEIKRYGKH